MPPLSLMIKPVSGLCNMRCSYCFYVDEMKNRDVAIFEKMNINTLEMIVKKSFIYAEKEASFVFQGGEPTLAGADFYTHFLELEKAYNKRRIPVFHAIQTNGYQIDDELLEVLRKGNFLMGISLDGTADIHDSRRKDIKGLPTYYSIMNNIERIKERQIDFNILCVVDDQIASASSAVFDCLCDFQFLQFIPCFSPIVQAGAAPLTPEKYGTFLSTIYTKYAKSLRSGKFISIRTFDNWLTMLSGYLPENCGAAGRCSCNYLVESNGNVYPCDFYALDEWKLGNINQQSFTTFLGSEKQNKFIRESLTIHSDCLACKYFFICRGGCKRECAQFHKTHIRKSDLCKAYTYFFKNHLEDMKKLAKQIIEGKLSFTH